MLPGGLSDSSSVHPSQELGVYAHDRIHISSGILTKYKNTTRFCLAMTIINLLLKPLTVVLAMKVGRERERGGGRTVNEKKKEE